MIKIFGLTTIAVATALLTGCGGGGGNSAPVSQISDIEKELTQTWKLLGKECHQETFLNGQPTGTSEKAIITFISNTDFTFDYKDYNNTTCDESGLTYSDTRTFEYIVGEKTKGAHGEDAYEMDITQTGWTLHHGEADNAQEELASIGETTYDMFLFNGEHLVFADESPDRDGSTKEKRFNDFNLSDFWAK